MGARNVQVSAVLSVILPIYIVAQFTSDTQLETFRAGICKVSDDDIVLFKTSYAECIVECKSRYMCESTSVYARMNMCYLHFDDEVPTTDCHLYVHSKKSNWIQKSTVGCETTECLKTQKCEIIDTKPVCVNSTGLKLGSQRQRDLDNINTARLGYPDYTSVWTLITAQSENKSTLIFNHGIAEVPGLVEVLVTPIDGPYKGLLLKAMGSAARDDDTEAYGGVVYIYNDVSVVVTVPKKNNGKTNGYAIYTGADEVWTGGSFYQSSSAYVKVRCWLPSNMPSVCFQKENIKVKSGQNTSDPTYLELNHEVGKLPDLVIVRTKLTDGNSAGWYSDSQGTNHFDIDPRSDEYENYGGIKFGYDSQTIRVWIPSVGGPRGYIFSVQDGWGLAGGHSTSGLLDVRVWCQIQNPVYMRTQVNIGPRVVDEQLTLNFISKERAWPFLDVFAAMNVQSLDGPNSGYMFNGIDSGNYQAADGSLPCYYGGFMYSFNTHSVTIRRPSLDHGAIVCIAHTNSNGTNTGATIDGIVNINMWKLVSEPLQEGPRSDEYSLYQRDRGTNYPDIGSVRASSLESCWDECSKRVLCKALKFTQTQNMCTLYDGFLTDQTYPENGSDIWQADDSN